MGKCFGASGQVADARMVSLTLDADALCSFGVLLLVTAQNISRGEGREKYSSCSLQVLSNSPTEGKLRQ